MFNNGHLLMVTLITNVWWWWSANELCHIMWSRKWHNLLHQTLLSLSSVTTVHSKLEICCKRHEERVSRDLEHNAEETPNSTDGFARWFCNLLAGLEQVVIAGIRTLLEKWETQCQGEYVCVCGNTPIAHQNNTWVRAEKTWSHLWAFWLVVWHQVTKQ
jgi:hypothetical protein